MFVMATTLKSIEIPNSVVPTHPYKLVGRISSPLSCGHTSVKIDIQSRYVKFFHSLIKSASPEIQVLSRYLARDVQSVTGRNLRLVQETPNSEVTSLSEKRSQQPRR